MEVPTMEEYILFARMWKTNKLMTRIICLNAHKKRTPRV